MKKIYHILFVSFILMLPASADKVMFIQNFENNTNDEKYRTTGKALADIIISDLVALKVDDLQVVERSRIDALVGELKLQTSEYFDPATIQKMGKGLGANLTLAGSFVVMEGEMRIDARLIDVTTSEIKLTFKAKGREDQFFELGEDLIKNIGEGLSIDTKSVDRDNLTGPSTLGALVEYGDAVELMDKGDYKAAADQLAKVRKENPKFKLSETASKEAMRKLYASKDNRETILSESESKLIKSALEKTTTKNHKVGLAYQWVLMESYFRQMKNIVGINPNESGGSKSLGDFGWVQGNMMGEKAKIPENEITKFTDNLKLYVQAYLAAIDHASKLDQMGLMQVRRSFSKSDENLIKDLGWNCPGIFPGVADMQDDLATLLLLETDFVLAPYKIEEKFTSMGFDLLEKATMEAAKPSNIHRIRDASRQMDRHADILLKHDKGADAIAKWQEILDKYPTYEEFDRIEVKIKNALEE